MRIWSPPRVTWGISLSILEPGAEETCAILPHIGTVAFGFSGRVFFSGGGRRFSRLVAKFLATMDSGIFFVHSVDLGMFGRVPATSLQTVASMCFFPRTAPRRAQVWARPVGAGGQQRQIPHVRRSHPGLGCLGSPFRSFNFDLRFLFRGLRAYTHPGLLCRSLARSLSLSFSVHPLHSGLARRVLFAADRRGVAAAAVPRVCTRSTRVFPGELGLLEGPGLFGHTCASLSGVHYTSARSWPRIRAEGVRPMDRIHSHWCSVDSGPRRGYTRRRRTQGSQPTALAQSRSPQDLGSKPGVRRCGSPGDDTKTLTKKRPTLGVILGWT